MKKIFFTLVFLLIPDLAGAHTVGAAGDGGLMAGLGHPVLGFDHLLAMVSVGILSAQMGGKAKWMVPAAFVSVMLLGGILGMMEIPFFSVELGIAFSVLALGVALALEKKLPATLAMLFVGFFALFHGHAHGTEMPQLAQPALYALGFVAATAWIHICGLLIGVTCQRFPRGAEFLRFAGAGIAGIGFHLLIL